MDEKRWQQIEMLFHNASALPPTQQAVWLAGACGDDRDLEDEVLRLLAGDRRSEQTVRRVIADASSDLVSGGIGPEAFRDARIGAWRVDRLLGEGGMGLVFLAHRDDGRFEQQAAIKLLRFTLATPADLERFRRERRILARLEHPRIARLLDAGEHPIGNGIEIPYFVMEHVDGEPLTGYARERQLTTRQRVELFQQVLDAVGYAHQRFVLHRDLKPANILVTARGEVKLLDFGISQLLEGDPAATPDRTRSSLMTPDYASPEQLRGEPLTVQSDVFTLGALLYELLSDRRAYDAPPLTPPTDRATAMDASPAAPLGIDADLDTIVAKAIHPDLTRRYPSVEACAADLRRYLAGQPVSARRDSAWYRARKFANRHRWPLGAAAIVMLSLAGGVVTTAYEARRANQHLAQLRQLSGRLLFQVHDAVESLQGATKARELLVTTSAEYLDGLSASAGDDQAFLLDLGASYERLARILGGPNSGHLGRPDEAIATYKKASEVYGRLNAMTPADQEVHRRQTRTLVATGRVQALNGKADDAEKTLMAALEAGRASIVAGTPWPYEVVESLLYLGDHFFDKAQPREALGYYHEALPEVERQAAADTTAAKQRNLTNVRVRIGQALIYVGNLPAARDEFQITLQRARANAAANPNTAAAQRDVYLMLDRLGAVTGHPDHPNLGDHEGAAALFAEAVATAERVSAADPKDMRARRDFAEMNASRAAALREFAPERAREAYQRVFDIYAGLPESMTTTPTVSRWLAQHHRNLGISLARMSQPDAALAELDRALAENTRLDMPADLAVTLTAMAELRLSRGDVRGARADAERALPALEGIWKDAHGDVNLRRRMAAIFGVLSEVEARSGACELARAWAQKREALWREIAGTDASTFVAAQLKLIAPVRCG
jgi:tetratricopeptide (TPR) repeat protein